MKISSLSAREKANLAELLNNISIYDMLRAGQVVEENAEKNKTRHYFYDNDGYKTVANAIEGLVTQLSEGK